MRNIFKEVALVVTSLLLTASMAYAMQPTKATSVGTTVKKEVAEKAVEPAKAAPEAEKVETPTPAPTPPPAPAPQPVVAPPTPTTGSEIMAAAGVAASDYAAVDYIVSHESGWCATKNEGEIGYCPSYHGYSQVGYGLCQSTPANKMATAGDDWPTNAVTQMKWCSSYAQARYGGWQAAYSHWLVHHNW